MPQGTSVSTDQGYRTGDGAQPHEVRFCSRCGITWPSAERSPLERVCVECGMGILLTSSSDAHLTEGASFLVVGPDLCIRAVGKATERILDAEDRLIGSSLLSVLRGPDGDVELAMCVTRATGGARQVITVPARLTRPNGRRSRAVAARVASCGPPRAALVVIETIGLAG